MTIYWVTPRPGRTGWGIRSKAVASQARHGKEIVNMTIYWTDPSAFPGKEIVNMTIYWTDSSAFPNLLD